MNIDAPKEPKVDSTLSKGLAILENLVGSQQGKGVTDLSKELGLTKSNTFRLLQTLTTLGYGDFAPATDFVRALASVEALGGQLYLVTVIAVLVGNLGRTRRSGFAGSLCGVTKLIGSTGFRFGARLFSRAFRSRSGYAFSVDDVCRNWIGHCDILSLVRLVL